MHPKMYKVERAGEGLKLNPARPREHRLLAGSRRRAALARLMAIRAELMFADEPTNHAGYRAIRWLKTS